MKISFKDFKKKYDSYVRDNYVRIRIEENNICKKTSVYVFRISKSNDAYLDKRTQEKIVRDLKGAGFVFNPANTDSWEYMKVKYNSK
jgi:hypothetical protein